MSKLLINKKLYKLTSYKNEAELEKVVVENYPLIFGETSVYFDMKKKVQAKKANIKSIPDGYLISFAEQMPKLYIIENEISSHDAYKHIGIQLWKFISSFKEGQMELKKILARAIKANKKINEKINTFIKETSFPNKSELLDYIIFEQDYGFIVVIDEKTEDMEFVLNQLANVPEVIELKKYVAVDNPNLVIYRFSEFLEEVKESLPKGLKGISEIDTIVCPARKEGFKKAFLEGKWWGDIRISPSIIPQIKYTAMYESAPVSAIRWIGLVSNIKPYKNTGKYRLFLTEIRKLKNEIKLTPEEGKKGIAPQSRRYTRMDLIKKAKKISDIF